MGLSPARDPTGVSVNGKPTASKPVTEGSNPSTPAIARLPSFNRQESLPSPRALLKRLQDARSAARGPVADVGASTTLIRWGTMVRFHPGLLI